MGVIVKELRANHRAIDPRHASAPKQCSIAASCAQAHPGCQVMGHNVLIRTADGQATREADTKRQFAPGSAAFRKAYEGARRLLTTPAAIPMRATRAISELNHAEPTLRSHRALTFTKRRRMSRALANRSVSRKGVNQMMRYGHEKFTRLSNGLRPIDSSCPALGSGPA